MYRGCLCLIKSSSLVLELHFKVEFADKTACAALEAYMTTMGQGKGVLTVAYVEQSKLPIEDDKQGKLISESQAKDTADDS